MKINCFKALTLFTYTDTWINHYTNIITQHILIDYISFFYKNHRNLEPQDLEISLVFKTVL